MNGDPSRATATPRWLLVLPLLQLAHVGEEWWGGPGFSAWTQNTLGMEIAESRFLLINAIGLVLFTAAIVAAVTDRRFAWLAAALSALFVLNGAIHLLLTLAFATYSPGVVTGVLLYLPIAGLALYTLSQRLPRPAFVGAVMVGVAIHAAVTITALG